MVVKGPVVNSWVRASSSGCPSPWRSMVPSTATGGGGCAHRPPLFPGGSARAVPPWFPGGTAPWQALAEPACPAAKPIRHHPLCCRCGIDATRRWSRGHRHLRHHPPCCRCGIDATRGWSRGHRHDTSATIPRAVDVASTQPAGGRGDIDTTDPRSVIRFAQLPAEPARRGYRPAESKPIASRVSLATKTPLVTHVS